MTYSKNYESPKATKEHNQADDNKEGLDRMAFFAASSIVGASIIGMNWERMPWYTDETETEVTSPTTMEPPGINGP